MSPLRSPADEDAVGILTSSHPPRLLAWGRGSKDLRHCLDTPSCRDNDIDLHPFRTAAQMGDQRTAPVVLVRADPSALEQAGKEIA